MFKAIRTSPLFWIMALPLFFFLHGWNEHWRDLDAKDVLPLLAAHILVSAVLFILFKRYYRDNGKAAIATMTLLAIHFFFGAVQDFFHAHVALRFLSRYGVLIPLILLGYGYLLVRLRKKQPGQRFIGFLSLVLIVLLAVELVMLPLNEFGKEVRDTGHILGPPSKTDDPDIYYIVTDEYASSRALREYMGYDNAYMDSALAGMDFMLMPDMHSNYNFTPFSVASTLNMGYLDWIPDTTACTPDDYNRCTSEIRSSKVCWKFIGEGYAIRNYSIFDLPGEPSPVGSNFLPVKGKLLMAQTLLMRAKKDLGHLILTGPLEIGVLSKDLIYGPGRNNDTLIARTIREAERKNTGPRFIYTHLYLPHPPFYVDSLGHPKDKATLQREMDSPTVEAYRQYLPHANAKILSLIKAIREKNDGPAIILLLSDHGFRGHGEAMPRDQHFMNYAAISLPEKMKGSFHAPASNINVFPELLDMLTKKKWARQPDKSIFLRDRSTP